ncbi:hypothetical protein [Chroococcus sp. FPU101]|uniref:GspE/PulE/PilB domain-containing protein n=1 Tax=Chroococcus sp. FPU101 TaxID=1974212 RepID=UPI001A8E5076|nr:hypothetical protein [Chroococcus sp. FPU101]GFE70541.1 hypothetical protein CFPU101_31510 [Chroococcus sp. FPU101]
MSSAHDFSIAALPPFVNQLLTIGYLTLPQVQQALIEKRQKKRSLTEIIESITGQRLPQDILKQYRTEQLFILKILHGLDVFDPEAHPDIWSHIEPLFNSLIPVEFCRRHQILPLARRDEVSTIITLAMVNPDQIQVLNYLKQMLKLSHVKFERKVMWRQDYQNLLTQYFSTLAFKRQLSLPELETSIDMNEVPSFIEDQQRAILKTKMTVLNQSQPKSSVIQQMLSEKLEKTSQLSKAQSRSDSQNITVRLQEVEKLISLLDQTFQSLKQEFESSSQLDVNEPTTENLEDAHHWETLVKEFISDQETMVADSYEELTDPGEWEKLREDLKPEQNTIVNEQRSLLDPWS